MTRLGGVTFTSGRKSNPQLVQLATFPSDATIIATHDTVPNLTHDTVILSAQSGDWDDASTWDLGRVPADGETVGVKTTHTVTVRTQVLGTFSVGVAGTLKASRAANSRLTLKHLFVYGPDTLGAGNYGELDFGTVASPVPAGVTAEVVWADVALDTDADPVQYGHGMVCFGRVRVHGATKTPFVRLSVEPVATDTALSLGSAVAGWQVGDVLYLPDTRQLTSAQLGGNFVAQWEYPVISSLGVGNTSVNLSGVLSHNHFGARDGAGNLDFLPHVANLTRNVRFRSANHNGVRGHAIFTGARCDIDVRHCSFEGMGRTTHATLDNTTFDGGGAVTHVGTNQIGRYAIHLHHVVGPEGLAAEVPQWNFEGVVVTDDSTSFDDRWGIAVHDSHYGQVKDCVVHHYSSWGIGTEEGNEDYCKFVGNFMARITGPGTLQGRIDSGSERGVHGRALYLSSPRHTVTGNVMCNTGTFTSSEYGYGISYFGHAGNSVATSVQVPVSKGSTTTQAVDIRGEKFVEFDDNEIYGQSRGMELWFYRADSSQPRGSGASSLTGLKIWHVYELGVFLYYNAGLTLQVIGRGDFSNIANAPGGILHQDYLAQDLVLDGCDIEGWGYGFSPTTNSYLGSPQTVRNSTFRCATGISLGHLWSSGGSSDWIGPRPVVVENCSFVAPPSLSLVAIDCALPDPATLTSAIVNWVVLNTCKVYDYQGVLGDDFQIWFDEQGGSEITPQTTVHPGNPAWNIWTGATASGQTNNSNWLGEAVAVCGAVRPAVGLESRTGIPQQVTDL